MWHMDAFFQWEAFIFLLSELRARATTSQLPHHRHAQEPDLDKAWFNVNKALEHLTDVLDIDRNPLHLAVASLAAKAWDAHVADAARHGRQPSACLQDYRALEVVVSKTRSSRSRSPPTESPQPQQPQQQLSVLAGAREAVMGERRAAVPETQKSAAGLSSLSSQSVKGTPSAGWSAPSLLDELDASPMDWNMWDEMLAEFGLGMEVFGGYGVSGCK